MKKIFFTFASMLSLMLVGCSGGGMTLKELAEMSEIERQQLTEIKLIVDLPEGAELNIWKTLDGCINLRKVEIDKRFKGTITGSNELNGPQHLETLIAEGATKIGYETFYASSYRGFNLELKTVKLPSVVELGLHAFGGNNSSNQIQELDFKNLMGLGSQLKGCRMLTTLKLGYDGPINIYTSFDGSLDTENIDLYLGKYEYENHVKGNVFYPHLYPNRTNGDYSLGDPDMSQATPSGEPITFKSIKPYN